jgi:hypothetical protein
MSIAILKPKSEKQKTKEKETEQKKKKKMRGIGQLGHARGPKPTRASREGKQL